MGCKPQLRFKEFGGEWKDTFLKELLSFKNGLNASKEKYGKGIKFINVLDILENNYIDYDNILDSVDATKEQIENYNVSYGDIVFQRSSETREEVGLTNVYLDKNKDCIFGGFVIRGKKVAKYNPFFLKLILNTSTIRKEITSRSGGSTRYNIGQNSLEKVEINLPAIEEQNKIAIFLLNLDEKIAILKEKLEKWNLFKKGVMQQLFSQELRFKDDNGNSYPEWEENKLGDLIQLSSSNLSINNLEENFGDYPLYGANGIIKNIDFYDKDEEYIAIVKDGAGVGRTFFCSKNSSILGTLNYLSIKGNNNLKFVYFLFNTLKFEKYIIGSTIPHIYFKDYSKEKIIVPNLEEQEKIANFLSEINEKTKKIDTELEINKKFKEGLLQKMFC